MKSISRYINNPQLSIACDKHRTMETLKIKIPFLEIVLMNIVIALFSLYSFEETSRSATLSLLRWGILLIWIIHLSTKYQSFKLRRRIIRLSKAGRICGFMLAWFLITIIIKSDNLLFSLEKWGALALLYVFGYVLLGNLYANTQLKKIFIISLSIQSAAILMIGYGTNLYTNIILFGSTRLYGKFLRPLTPSIMAGLLIILTISLTVEKRRKKKLLIIMLITSCLISFLILYATGTRTAIFATIIVICIWAITIKKGTAVLITIFGIVLFVGSDIFKWYDSQRVFVRPTSSYDGLTGRSIRYEAQYELFKENIWQGTGFASSPTSARSLLIKQDRALDHSAYLGALTETGIIGGLLFLVWIISSVSEAFVNARINKKSWIDQYCFMFILCLSIISIFEALLLMAGNVLILSFYVLSGLTGIENKTSLALNKSILTK